MQAQGRWMRRSRASPRAGAIHRQQENDRNSINIEPITETPPLADSCEQTPDRNVEQSRCMSNPSLPSPTEPCYSSPAASAQVPIIVNPELARCSKRSPRLAGASSVAYPAWEEEESKKPPSIRQANRRQAVPALAGQIKGASRARLPLLEHAPRLLPQRCSL